MTTTRGHATLKEELRMNRLTRGLGAVLIVVGVVAFILTGASSPTALIRAVLGLAILALGFLASRPALHRHAIHGAMLLAIILVAGSAPVAATFMMHLMSAGPAVRPGAGAAYTITLLLCAAYLVVGIRSFVAEHRTARRYKEGKPNG